MVIAFPEREKGWIGSVCSALEDGIRFFPPALAERAHRFLQHIVRALQAGDLCSALTAPETTPFIALIDAFLEDLGSTIPRQKRVLIGLGAIALYLCVRIQDDVVDREPHVDRPDVYLSEAFGAMSVRALAEAVGDDRRFLRFREQMEIDARSGASAPLPESRLGEKFLPMAIPMGAVACIGGRPSDLDEVASFTTALGLSLQLANDILNVAEDHRAGRITPLLLGLYQDGMPRDAAPHAIRGSLLGSERLTSMLSRAREACERAARMASGWPAPGVARVCRERHRFFDDIPRLLLQLCFQTPSPSPGEGLPGRRPDALWASGDLSVRPRAVAGDEIDRAIAFSRRYPFSPDMQEAWEFQCGEVFGQGAPVGDLFTPLVILEAMAAAGEDIRQPLSAAFARRRGIGIRYYRNAPRMPLDADSAAAVINAASCAAVVEPEWNPILDEARAVLAAALQDDGALHTWVALPGVPQDYPLEQGLGFLCSGVAGRALDAILRDEKLARTLPVEAAIRWLIQRAEADGGFSAVHYPDRVVATSIVVMALVRAKGMGLLSAAQREATERAIEWLSSQQRPSGRIGSGTLSTAYALWALSTAGRCSLSRVADAAAALVHAQRWDGGWPEEPYFLCPYPDGSMRPFGSASLTTAMARMALTTARSHLVAKRSADATG
jgi:hypothetical protein